MPADRSNIVLIGMPGAGKSTVGVILAKKMAMDFIDTDLLIQRRQKRTLQEIVDSDGYFALRRIEEEVLLGLSAGTCVISTGGSAVYSQKGMESLKSSGIVIFLDVALETLEKRVHDYHKRGLAKRPDQSFEELFAERFALYTGYADITITCDHLTPELVCDEIIGKLEGYCLAT